MRAACLVLLAAVAVAVAVAVASPARAQAGAHADPDAAGGILQRARQEASALSGKADLDPATPARALSSALQARLDRSFARAHAAVRPKWYEPARIDEITGAGDGSTRIYRITTAVGTYCVAGPKDGRAPTYGLCNEPGP